MELKSKMKTAVVGSGEISEIYLKNMINRFSILDVVGCCSKNNINAQKRASEFHIKTMTFEEILNDKDIELVVNLTPALAHYDIIKRSLSAGKHVYTEKTISPVLEQVKELQNIAVQNKLRIGCAPDTFLGSAIQTAKKALDEGLIGTVTSCHAVDNRNASLSYTPGRFTTQPGGGIGFDVGIYYITALLYLLGPVKAVNGLSVNTTPEYTITNTASPYYGQTCTIENENMMLANLIFKNGILGTLHFNGRCIDPEVPSITLYGTKGILTLPDPNCFGGQVKIMKEGETEFSPLNSVFGFSDNSRGIGAAEMAWSIRLNRPHRANITMGLHAVDLLNCIVASNNSSKTQYLSTEFSPITGLPEGINKNEEVVFES